MSGPKCDSYYVEPDRNELLIAAQRAEAARAARLARERLEAALAKGRDAQRMMAQIAAAGRSAEEEFDAAVDTLHQKLPQLPTSSGTVAQIEKYVQEVERAIAQISAEIGRAEGLSRLRSLVGASTITKQVADWSDEFVQRQQTSGVEDARSVDQGRTELVDRILGRLQGAAKDDELASIQQIVREILEAKSTGRADSLEAELRLRVQKINERLLGEQKEVAQANELLAKLRGLKGKEVELVRQELMTVVSRGSGLSKGLVARTHQARTQATRRANDEYAGKVVREELERLGYSIGEEFSTLFTDGGEVVLSRPEDPEYGVEMQVDASHGTLDLQVVRLSEKGGDGEAAERKSRDKSAEERWCADHDKLRSVMRARGLGGRVIKHLPPGAKPVNVAKAAGAQGKRAARAQGGRRADHLKQREL